MAMTTLTTGRHGSASTPLLGTAPAGVESADAPALPTDFSTRRGLLFGCACLSRRD
jgi:hypothetical protein